MTYQKVDFPLFVVISLLVHLLLFSTGLLKISIPYPLPLSPIEIQIITPESPHEGVVEPIPAPRPAAPPLSLEKPIPPNQDLSTFLDRATRVPQLPSEIIPVLPPSVPNAETVAVPQISPITGDERERIAPLPLPTVSLPSTRGYLETDQDQIVKELEKVTVGVPGVRFPDPSPVTRKGAEFGIEGEAAQRVVISRPASPLVEAPSVADVRLRFLVAPDGSVAEVYPVVRGDAVSDREAIKYFRRWRFNPIPDKNLFQEGLITIRFKTE